MIELIKQDLGLPDTCLLDEMRAVVSKYFADDEPQDVSAPDDSLVSHTLPGDEGFGIGIPETQKLQELNYDEADTLSTDEIKKDFPILQQKVNGHDLVWLDNGATTQKPNVVIDKISDYYRNYN